MGTVVDFPNDKITLYDFNKINMAQIKPYDPIVLYKRCQEIAKEIYDAGDKKVSNYWMLLCRERNDYTVFCIKQSLNELISALQDCFMNRGHVLDITKQPDNNYEIWIRDFDTNENVVYYLFDYNSAIIEV